MRDTRWTLTTLFGTLVLIILFVSFLGPKILGDTPSYVQAVGVMQGTAPAADFIPNRLLTTFGGLEIVRFFGAMFGGLYHGWFFLNLILYVTSVYVLYALVRRMTGSAAAGCLASLFLAGNYGFLLFGPNFLMDIGGWAFYIFSLYFLWRYAESKACRYLVWSSVCVGIGGLFKEYAFLGGAAIGTYLVIEIVRRVRGKTEWQKPLGLLVCCGPISVIPVALLYAYIYHRFGYTYLDWLGFNATYYTYHSRILEYIKALGSLYNLLAILFIGGAVVVVRQWRQISVETKMFVAAALVSFLPVLCWPAITQRILTITVPFAVIVAAFLFRKYERQWWVFAFVLALYVLATFFMDSYLLTAINLPI